MLIKRRDSEPTVTRCVGQCAFMCGSPGGKVSYDQSGACEVDIRYMSFCPTSSDQFQAPVSLTELSAANCDEVPDSWPNPAAEPSNPERPV